MSLSAVPGMATLRAPALPLPGWGGFPGDAGSGVPEAAARFNITTVIRVMSATVTRTLIAVSFVRIFMFFPLNNDSQI
jgi:hypothetical protein